MRNIIHLLHSMLLKNVNKIDKNKQKHQIFIYVMIDFFVVQKYLHIFLFLFKAMEHFVYGIVEHQVILYKYLMDIQKVLIQHYFLVMIVLYHHLMMVLFIYGIHVQLVVHHLFHSNVFHHVIVYHYHMIF